MAAPLPGTLGGDRRRGRPPIPEHRQAVLEATREVIAKTGYGGMTLEAVARQAGLYRRYINRTWGSKAALVRDALFQDVVHFSLPDTGVLRDDLRAVVEQHVDLTLRPEFLRGLPGLTVEFQRDPALFRDTLDRFVQPPVQAMSTVFDRALARGEIAHAPAPGVVVSTISGAIQQLALLGLLDRQGLVDHALAIILDGLVELEN